MSAIVSVAFGAAEPEPVGVVDVPARGLLGQLGAVTGRRLVDLVVDVGDVGGELDLVAALQQPVPEPDEDDVGTRVTDVDALVDGRAADVDADLGRWRR